MPAPAPVQLKGFKAPGANHTPIRRVIDAAKGRAR